MAMLSAAGVIFTPVAADIDEEAVKSALVARVLSPKDLATALAVAKVRSLVGRYPLSCIIGCDQTLECHDGSLLNKASSLTELGEQLHDLSGQSHWLHSASVAFERGDQTWMAVESVRLKMRVLSRAFVDEYVARFGQSVLGCVGGYQIEEVGVQLFEQIDGSHFAIMGLPLLPLLAFLRERGMMMA